MSGVRKPCAAESGSRRSRSWRPAPIRPMVCPPRSLPLRMSLDPSPAALVPTPSSACPSRRDRGFAPTRPGASPTRRSSTTWTGRASCTWHTGSSTSTYTSTRHLRSGSAHSRSSSTQWRVRTMRSDCCPTTGAEKPSTSEGRASVAIFILRCPRMTRSMEAACCGSGAAHSTAASWRRENRRSRARRCWPSPGRSSKSGPRMVGRRRSCRRSRSDWGSASSCDPTEPASSGRTTYSTRCITLRRMTCSASGRPSTRVSANTGPPDRAARRCA